MMKTSAVDPKSPSGSMRPGGKSKYSVVLTALTLSLLLAGCGGGNTDSMLTSAKEYLAKNDHKAAVIQIKNALQTNPDSPEARYLLGSALLKSGDAANAEAEFRKAQVLNHSPDQLVPELARAMLSTRQYKKLTDEFSNTPLTLPRAKAELQVILATAYSEQGNKDRYQAALAGALVAEPGFAPALTMQARQKVMLKDYDGALALVDEVIAKTPTSAEAWSLKGDILYFTKNQPKEALEAYRKVIEIRPELILGQTSVLAVLLGMGDLEEVAKQLEALKKLAPNHPQTKFFQTQLAYQKRDFKAAREFAQQLLRMTPDNPRAMQLAGVVEFQLNALLQAEALLSKAVAAAPDLVLARRILIMTYLRSGQAAKALASLNQGIAKGVVDPEINTVAGEVYLQNGDIKKAEEYFAKALKLAPKDARKRTSLALTQMVGGNVDTAFGELQDIASSDSGATADMALISAHLRRGELDKALLAIDGLEKKQPDKPLAANLRGRTLLAKKDVAGARKSFERALVIDPLFFPAVASLASLDIADKKPEDAKKRFEAVLAKNPKNGQALLAIAELAARGNASKEEVSALINKAVEANPTEAMPRVLLIEYHLGHKDLKQAMSVAQNAFTALPDSPEVLEALGRVQLQSGEQNQAISSFNKLAAMQPLLPRAHLLLADAQLAAKNKDGAAQNLRRALDIKPDLIEAQRGLIMLNLDAKKYPEAASIARTVQTQRPKESIGYVLEGDVGAAQKNWDAAATAFKAGLKSAPSSELAIKLHAITVASGKTADADKFSATWVKDHASDAAFQFYLGDLAIVKKDYAVAEKNYSAVVKLQPTNAAALNNLAWVTGQLNKPGAIEFAEKAIKLAPNQPALMDTLAMLLSDKNDYAKALEWQTKVIAAQPQNPLFKLNLAKIHIKGDKKDLARKELDELAKLGDKFAGQAEVATLLKAL